MHLKTWRLINEVSSQTQPQDGSRQREPPSKDEPGHSHFTASGLSPVPKPRSLFISLSRSMCFQCVRARAPASTCASFCYLGSSQTESFTPGGSLVPPLCSALLCRTHCVYSPANIINMADDRGLGGMWRWAAQLQCHCLIPGMPWLRGRWMRKTRAPERPCHPGHFTFAFQLAAGFQVLKERRSKDGISNESELVCHRSQG